MPANNTIALRPRFKLKLHVNNQVILNAFETAKTSQNAFVINRIDNHVFIKYPKKEQQFWTPQLHLEIDNINNKTSILNGLFGPNPTVWTLFMFLHFIVATLFIGFSIWAYSNWKLNTNFSVQIAIMLLMIIIWFALYFAGIIGKASSKTNMYALHDFMHKILSETKANPEII